MSKYRNPDWDQLAAVFRALGNPHRLRILVHLATCCHPGAQHCNPGAQCCGGEGDSGAGEPDAGGRSANERRVGELGGGLTIVASTLSHHIKELGRAAVMSCHKRGKCVMCCVDRDMLRQLSLLFAVLAGDEPLPEGWTASTKPTKE